MLAHTLRNTGLAAARAAKISCNALLVGEQSTFGWTRGLNTRTSSESLVPERIQWVFLGPPGVGKGTYSTRVAVALGVAHIAAGDLVRGEIKSGSPTGLKMKKIVETGQLLPDEMTIQLLKERLETGRTNGEKGFVLDGFPRTVSQAKALAETLDIQLAVNLSLREEVLVQKCEGRRVCKKCGKNWNVADIHLPATASQPEIVMPPLDPPVDCLSYMEQRSDDQKDVILKRLEVYHNYATPVEDFYREKGTLLDFEITGGIPETLPGLLTALRPHTGNWRFADIFD